MRVGLVKHIGCTYFLLSHITKEKGSISSIIVH